MTQPPTVKKRRAVTAVHVAGTIDPRRIAARKSVKATAVPAAMLAAASRRAAEARSGSLGASFTITPIPAPTKTAAITEATARNAARRARVRRSVAKATATSAARTADAGATGRMYGSRLLFESEKKTTIAR